MACAKINPPIVVDLVKLYQINWGAWPEYLAVDGEERRIGFELQLCGVHEPGTVHLGPGCPGCRHTYEALREIAERILPAAEQPSVCRVCPYGQALCYSKARGSRPDVLLHLKILHHENGKRVARECKLRCLEAMKAKLAELGACQRPWCLHEILPGGTGCDFTMFQC